MGWRQRYDLSRLRQVVPIIDLLERCGLREQLHPSRGELVGPCPLPGHSGDRSNRSAFRVNPARNCWHCFSHCGGGDSVELAARLQGGDYAAAARLLASIEGNGLPRLPRPQAPPLCPMQPFRPYTRRLALLADHPFLHGKGIRPSTAACFESGFWPRQGFLDGCIGVRLHDVDGRPLGYAGRRLEPDAIARWGKWRLPSGMPRRELLFNWHRVWPQAATAPMIVVEGPFDAMRVHQAGFTAVVALLGTQLSAAQLSLLQPLRRIVLLLDGDQAGGRAARQIATTLSPGRAIVVQLPSDRGPPDLTDDQLRAILAPSASHA